MKTESCSIDSKAIVYYRMKSVAALSTEVSSEVNWTSCIIIFIHKNDHRTNRIFIIFIYKTNLVKKMMAS